VDWILGLAFAVAVVWLASQALSHDDESDRCPHCGAALVVTPEGEELVRQGLASSALACTACGASSSGSPVARGGDEPWE
jgi:hypothetical protein